MTDISVSAANTAQAAATYAASQAANTAAEPAAPSASADSGVQTTATGSTMPGDTVELSDEALAALYDDAYRQWLMGPLYDDDTVAGWGSPFGRAIIGNVKVVEDENGEQHFAYDLVAFNPGTPTGDYRPMEEARNALWSGQPRMLEFGEVEAFRAHQIWEEQALRQEKQNLFFKYSMNTDSDEYQQDLQALYQKYGRDSEGNRPVDPLQQAIHDLFLSSGYEEGMKGALDLALRQRGIDKSDVADIDLNHAILDGHVLVTFKNGADPVELDEGYLSYFATGLLIDRISPQKDALQDQFYASYHSLLESYGLTALDTEGWSVTQDGKFHFFTAYQESGIEKYEDHEIDDPALVAQAIAYTEIEDDWMRLSWSHMLADNRKWAWISGYDPPEEGPPVYDDPPIDQNVGGFLPIPESPPAQPAGEAGSVDAPVEAADQQTKPEETEEEKEKARARRRFLLSMGIRAESDPDANKPDWMSSGEIARLNARYADAMSARDRMIQRFSHKGELEGITDNRPGETRDTA